MIRYAKPSRIRDAIGLLMLMMTAFLLWAETSDRVTGVGADEQVDVVVVAGVETPAPRTPGH